LSRSETVAGRLTAEVTAQRLQADAGQLAAAVRLDALSDALRAQWSGGLVGGLAGRLARLRGRLPWLSGGGRSTRRPGSAPPRGLYLWGGVGRGKTLLMDLFFASLSGTLPGTEGSPPAARTHFYQFMRDVHGELARVRQRAEPLERVAQLVAERARVLCLDEFMVADIADAMILARLFEGLFRRGVTLVATSNLPPRDLYRDGLQRQRFLPAISLLCEHVDVVHLDGGTDYRLRLLEQAPTYLDSKLAGTAAALRRRFAELSGGIGTGPTTMNIEGRALHALDAGPGTVWFGFAELCGGPRSQHDYIELARTHHTIFIADIPIFKPADDDAARRFIMLLDELYDRGVSIVVSAAAAPADLYQGERLRFDFERAASRLMEMQSRQYLAGRQRFRSPARGIIAP
jgi:cell division protein ZapE